MEDKERDLEAKGHILRQRVRGAEFIRREEAERNDIFSVKWNLLLSKESDQAHRQ